MEFFRLPLELRRMIYKELCPSTLHFPYASTQDGLQLLATSHQTRAEFISELRSPTSFVLHLPDRDTTKATSVISDFLDWIKPRSPHGSPHLTKLILKTQSFPIGDAALISLERFWKRHDSTGDLAYCVEHDYGSWTPSWAHCGR